MSDNLPSDVLVDILSRLPVKSLIRFTCVSKLWYSLITNPSFISTHLNRTLSNPNPNPNNQFLLVRHYNMFQETERFALYYDNERFNEYAVLECPVTSVNDYFRIVGSCHGLICLVDDFDTYTDTIVIWNPSVRKSLTLPKPGFSYASQGSCLVGFGFDALSNDYKVVRIVYQHNTPDDHNYKVPPNVEIWELRTGEWRSICGDAPNCVMYSFFPLPCLTNGAVHWVASEKGSNGGFHNMIEAFDMGTEVFREIMMPNDLEQTEVLKLSVSVLGESLALIQYQKIWESEYCWVWKMKEYGVRESWTRVFTIDMREGIRKVVGFKKNNDVLLSARVRGLVSYDPNIQDMESLGIRGTNRSFYADTYVETFVLFNGGNRALQLENPCGAVIDEGITPVVSGEGGTEEQQKLKLRS